MISRQDAYDLVKKNVTQKNLVKHILAVEAVMIRLAEYFGEDEQKWGLVGLLHDLDYSVTADKPSDHTFITEQWLTEAGAELTPEMLHAIRAHPGHIPCKSRMDWALYCSDPVTGLIVAGVLMHPDKKLASVTSEYMLRRFKEKRFAAGAGRDEIAACEKIELTLDEFMTLALEGMTRISPELGF
ncbi:MAG: HD domain-containing protein [Candidatus Zixiibacteriota bacterium]